MKTFEPLLQRPRRLALFARVQIASVLARPLCLARIIAARIVVALCLLSSANLALASIDSAVAWLNTRQSADQGVHRASDLANRVDTNAETLLSLQRVGRTAGFEATAARAISDRRANIYSLARQARIRLDLGQSAATQLSELSAAQNADGGFPPVKGLLSEPITSAYMVALFERAGQGASTAATRTVAYLIASQQTDGGWLSASGNLSSVFASAEATLALIAAQSRVNVVAPLARARTFLLSKKLADHSFGALLESGFAIDALLALSVPRADLQPSALALSAQQLGSGSFANDAYVTAVVLRALWQFEQPELPSNGAGIQARVLSAATELPIEGATLTLSGTAAVGLTSNNQGRLQSATLLPGPYSVRLSFTGMRDVIFDITVPAGRVLDLGDLRLIQGNTPQDNFAIIRGMVISQGANQTQTGAPIEGATVRIDGTAISTQSDSAGRYQFLQVPPGVITVKASATGYSSAQSQLTVLARSLTDLTFELSAQAAPQTGATIRGVVLQANTNQPLAGVQIAVTAGAPLVNTQTAADGSYTLQTAIGTAVSIRAAKAGFDAVAIQTPLIDNQVLIFAPKLYATGTTPTGANTASISGTIVNQANRRAIADALIVISDPSGQRTVRSSIDGTFSVTGLQGPNVRLAVSADAFEAATLLVPVAPLQVRALGQIGLKPTTIAYYLPDLRVVGSTLASSEPDTFALAAQFSVDVTNAGTALVAQDFNLLAFIDANGNGSFEPGDEPEVGRVRYDRDVPIGASATIAIAVTAQLLFRDAPVAFMVDPDNEVIEDNNGNNTGSSLLGCRVTPAFIGQSAVREKWHWRGLSANPAISSLLQTPNVTQLTDDNGDGAINQFEIPDLVFVAGEKISLAPSRTALVAVRGDTGAEIWSRTEFTLSHFSALATGDIDNDGLPEIIAVSRYREELFAFEHDGTLKWRVRINGPGIPRPLIPPPPSVWDQPIIVNLEGDQEAEILLGKRAFRGATGELLWTGNFDEGGSGGGKPELFPLKIAYGVASIAADVDLNGVMEVIAGRTLYDSRGNTVWHRGDIYNKVGFDVSNVAINEAGFNAVGNFDTDNFAEIVLAIGNELWLLEHTGATIWGPKAAPDGTAMGAPTVADIDQDGLPEILISSLGKLTAFESDGTVKWTKDIEDPSGSSSATVFDFQNDGNLEVVHTDEKNLRIFDAKTGNQLYFTFNKSPTVYEYPIVADVDGDKEADIVITSFESDSGVQTQGVRVLEATGGAWADAGSVWSSHAFHIDNVRENSTIPLLETPSWLTHNSYRVQQSPYPDPLGMPDFSVGDLRLIDRGPGQTPIARVRVGNAGPVDAHSPALLGLYRGDPAAGGTLIRQVRLDTLQPSRFQVVELGEVNLTGSGQLFAVVDQGNLARECREQNNQRAIAFSAINGLGDLGLSTDKLSYRPGEQVIARATVLNQGALPANYSVTWLIRDGQNRVTATLSNEAFDNLAAGATQVRTQNWNSTGTLAGSYVLSGQLRNAEGVVIDTATVSFAIAGDSAGPAGDSAGPAGGISVRPTKAVYGTLEVPQLLLRLQNLSSSEVIRTPEALIRVTGPSGFNLETTLPYADLFTAATLNAEFVVQGARANGNYAVVAQLRSRLNGFLYATDNTSFEIRVASTQLIEGVVNVARASLPVGQTQSCLFTVRNRGSAVASNVALRRRVVELDTGVERLNTAYTSTIVPGTDSVVSQDFATTGFSPGDHACLLEVQEGSVWRLLASQAFIVEGSLLPGIVVAPTQGLRTSEAGQTANFSVRLATAPSASVTIALTNPDATEFALSAAQLVFTPSNWSDLRTVTVTGVNDDLSDGDQTGVIRVEPAVSADVNYSGRDGDDVSATNLDDDGPSIRVSPVAIDVAETGSTAVVNISVNTEPTAAVTIAVSSSDSSEFALSATSVTITPQNWQMPQALTVTGVDDTELDGLQIGAIVTSPAVSSDTRYNGLNPADVVARNADNELPGIIVEPTSVTTRESGTAQSVQVRLNVAPTGAVTIPIGAVDSSEWSVLDLNVVLNASNWQQGRTIVITPVNDDDFDGDQTGLLRLQPATSSDIRFNGIDASDVALTNLDDDGAQIIVEPISGLVVSENGSTATFRVRLTLAPTAAVQLALSSGDSTEFSVAPNQLTFTPTAFDDQIVTVTGLDDAELDGNIVGQIITAAATSSDERYNGINPPNVLVTNIDNETVQVLVTPNGSIATSEDGTSAAITVRLSVAPTSEARITLSNSNAGEWRLDRSALIFPAGTVEQTVIATGVNDFVIDGDILGVIGLAPIVSTDVRFNGIDPVDVPAINRDNDVEAAFIIAPTGLLTTTEAGGSAFFDIRLSTEPSADVTVPLSNSDATEFSLDRTQVQFDRADWQTPRRVVVTGVDDALVDGDIEGLIALLPAQSADARFQGIDAPDVRVINLDNDTLAPAQVRVLAPDLTTSEAGDTGRLEISLNRAPTGTLPVIIGISSNRTDETISDPVAIRFDASNAGKTRVITLHGVDEFIDDGDQAVELTVRVLPGSDADFLTLAPQRFTVSNLDNDTAAVSLTLTGPATIVEGESSQLALRLGSMPTAAVRIELEALIRAPGLPNDMNFTLLPSVLDFAPAQWDQAQTITLRTSDNLLLRGDRTIEVRVKRIISKDALYPPLTALPVAVLVREAGQVLIQVPLGGGIWLLALCLILLGSVASQRSADALRSHHARGRRNQQTNDFRSAA